MKLDKYVIEEGMTDLKEQKIIKLKDIVECLSNGNYRLKVNGVEKSGAVYVFWWIGSEDRMMAEDVNRIIHFQGPNGRKIQLEFSQTWIRQIKLKERIPLYAGKTADNLQKRIGLHLQLKTKRSLGLGQDALFEKRKSTSNQVRDRLERMFINEADIRQLMLNNIGLSYVLLHGDAESVNRFYLEDKAIGELLPLFNIDTER